MREHIRQGHVRFNMVVNILDGSFFGAAMGFASFAAIIPLFVSTLTDSATLIGLISAIHAMGWQLPQLLMARRVSQLRRYKPMVILMTLNERLPFLGLGVVAWFAATLGATQALALTFFLLIWQGLGGGFTAAAWQSMIGKIMPSNRRGTFFGLQAAAANLLSTVGALAAARLLVVLPYPGNYAVCFAIAGVLMLVSWSFLASTREADHEPQGAPATQHDFWQQVRTILRQDRQFCWFVGARMLSQLALMAPAFFAVYTRQLGASITLVSYLTALLLITQTISNPIMGWLGDRFGHRGMMEVGALAALLSALIAFVATSPAWFYPVCVLAGIANVAFWNSMMALTMDFGTLALRPTYIGLANSLTAPATLLAPLMGGWLADTLGYQTTFGIAAAGSILTWIVLHWYMRPPAALQPQSLESGIAC